MKKPYVVGEMRACARCGAEFARAIRRISYCPPCETRLKQQWARARAERTKKTPRAYSRGGSLPGGTRLATPYQAERVLRITHITFLPSCRVCHRYGDYCPEHGARYG